MFTGSFILLKKMQKHCASLIQVENSKDPEQHRTHNRQTPTSPTYNRMEIHSIEIAYR
ncbi:UNVERIFIED_CONTAM: hypothetical protein FKN15_020994 [Acipenser sinensis]